MSYRSNGNGPFALILGGSFEAGLGIWLCHAGIENVKAFEHYGVAPTSGYLMSLFGAAIVVLGLATIVYGAHLNRKEKALQAAITDMTNASGAVSPREFLKHKGAFLKDGDYTGVYVIHNVSKDMYYVGQSVRVIGRVTQHFTGHGNGDVYADYKYGDTFTINTIALSGSGYNSLDALERDAIQTYHAFDRGYNRTRGNRN